MIQRLQSLFRDFGKVDGALYLVARLFNRATFGKMRIRKYLLVSQPVHESDLTPPRRGRTIEVTEAFPDEVRGLDLGRPAHAIDHRLRHGCRCLVARKDGQILGFQWFTLADYPEDEVRCTFVLEPADRRAWDFDIVVHPEARALPVFTRLWDRCNAILRESSIRATLSRIDAFNAQSRRSHARLGAQTIGWAVFVTTGDVQFSMFSSRPWVHLGLSDRSVPAWPVSGLGRRGK